MARGNLNRIQRRNINRRNKQRGEEFEEIPPSEWPLSHYETSRFKVCVNKEFLVQLFEENDNIIRMSVNRVTVGSDGGWDENISWDELHQIKAKMGYSNRYAIEIYPDLANLVNVANMRHLWILPEPLNIGWGYFKS